LFFLDIAKAVRLKAKFSQPFIVIQKNFFIFASELYIFPTMRKSLLLLLLLPQILLAQVFDPIKWSYQLNKVSNNEAECQIVATIDEGWHLYTLNMPDGGPRPTSVVFTEASGLTPIGSLLVPKDSISEYDVNFDMQLSYYKKRAVFVQRFSVSGGFDSAGLRGYIEFMACNDEMCLPPQTIDFTLGNDKNLTSLNTAPVEDVTEFSIAEVAEIEPANASQPTDTDSQTSHTSLWYVFLMGLLGGLLAVLMPCIWPIIPMTVSFFLKRGQKAEKKGQVNHGKRDAILYGLSIVVIYVVLGLLITAIFGASKLNEISTSAWLNITLFLLLLVFAISFFGAFEIHLPSRWSTWMDNKANDTSGIVSILLMAFTLVIVSFSCTSPIIGTLLVELASQGFVVGPTIGMLGFAIALALPFSLCALFPDIINRLPKSGDWMNTLKVTLAFIELAFSLKFLSVADLAYGWHLIDRETFLTLWIVIFALLACYLFGWLSFKDDNRERPLTVTRLMLGMVSLAFAIYMLPGLWGAPLRAVSAFAPPMSTQDFTIQHSEMPAHFYDYDAGMAFAKANNKKVFLDFTGYGCVNCRKMEAAVLADERVNAKLTKDYVIISLYVDDKTALDQPIEITENGQTRTLKTIGDKWSYKQRSEYGSNAQPYYIVIDKNEKRLSDPYAYDEDVDKFLEWLR